VNAGDDDSRPSFRGASSVSGWRSVRTGPDLAVGPLVVGWTDPGSGHAKIRGTGAQTEHHPCWVKGLWSRAGRDLGIKPIVGAVGCWFALLSTQSIYSIIKKPHPCPSRSPVTMRFSAFLVPAFSSMALAMPQATPTTECPATSAVPTCGVSLPWAFPRRRRRRTSADRETASLHYFRRRRRRLCLRRLQLPVQPGLVDGDTELGDPLRAEQLRTGAGSQRPGCRLGGLHCLCSVVRGGCKRAPSGRILWFFLVQGIGVGVSAVD
jgi:hypothetical protein